jgi:PAS domain S-box-containing protein
MNLILETEDMRKMEKQQWLQAVVNNLGKALLTTDEKGNVTFLNEPASSLAGKSNNELIGLPMDRVLPLYSASTHKAFPYPIHAAVTAREVFDSEQSVYLKHPDGRALFATYTVSPLLTEEGNVQGTVIMVCTFAHDPKIIESQNPSPLSMAVTEEGIARNEAVFTKRDGQFVRLLLGDVLWVEAMENYVQVVTREDRFVVHTTMKKLADRLADQGFVRVHRSYIVPVDRVDSIEENRIRIGEAEIPIGKAYRRSLMDALTFI